MKRNLTRRGKRAFTLIELCVVMSIISVLAAILFPVFAQAREAARKCECQSHLQQVGLALQLYARDHDGRLPIRDQDFSPLVGSYITDSSVFRCAADWLPEAGLGPNPAYFSYQYRGGLTLEDRADIPIAADWELRHGGGANVLYLSGSVRWRGISSSSPSWVPLTAGPRPLPAGAAGPARPGATPFIETDNAAPAAPAADGSNGNE